MHTSVDGDNNNKKKRRMEGKSVETAGGRHLGKRAEQSEASGPAVL